MRTIKVSNGLDLVVQVDDCHRRSDLIGSFENLFLELLSRADLSGEFHFFSSRQELGRPHRQGIANINVRGFDETIRVIWIRAQVHENDSSFQYRLRVPIKYGVRDVYVALERAILIAKRERVPKRRGKAVIGVSREFVT